MVEPPEKGCYLEDGTRLFRVLERRKRGLLLLENCAFPDSAPLAFTVAQLKECGLRVVRRQKSRVSDDSGVV